MTFPESSVKVIVPSLGPCTATIITVDVHRPLRIACETMEGLPADTLHGRHISVCNQAHLPTSQSINVAFRRALLFWGARGMAAAWRVMSPSKDLLWCQE